jgi:hypothetical protein
MLSKKQNAEHEMVSDARQLFQEAAAPTGNPRASISSTSAIRQVTSGKPLKALEITRTGIITLCLWTIVLFP